jgi:hypothetical protein
MTVEPMLLQPVTSTPSLYLFLCVSMFIRLPYCFRLYRWHSHLNSPNARFISALTHVKFSTGFVVKQLMREHTFVLLGIFTVAFLLVFGYCLYMIERCVGGFAVFLCRLSVMLSAHAQRDVWLRLHAKLRPSYVLGRAVGTIMCLLDLDPSARI